MPEASTPAAARWGRRDVLRLGLALPVLAGCSASPAVAPAATPGTTAPRTTRSGAASPGPASPGPASPGPASPGPAPSVPAVANAEQALSAYAGAVLAGAHRKDLSGDLRTLLTFLRDAHADHAVALAGQDPTSRPTSAAPSPQAPAPRLGGLSLSGSLTQLAKREAAQAAALRRAAVGASGLTALLSGSLAVAADAYAAALGAARPPGVSAPEARRPEALLTDVEAARQLVAQLHAVVFGYQLAIGKLKFSSAERRRAVGELAATRRLVDTQVAFLLRREAEVPVPEPAYAAPFAVRSPADAGRLVRGLQSRLEAYVGLTLAAAPDAGGRTRALALLTSTSRTALAWGAPLQVWPGWSD